MTLNKSCVVKEDMNIAIVGHVDHGKSTIIGRLLSDTSSLPEGKLEQVKEMCRRNSRPFEYAFLLDALKDEQAQGITIDSARCFFKTKKRNYTIIDAPGHLEFLKNMITGASRAEAALLVIDASEGVRENSRRHAYMLSTLGIKQVVVLINKMDLVNYDKKVYKNIIENFTSFSRNINLTPKCFIPVSGIKGDNIGAYSKKMKWYMGKTVLEVLDLFSAEKKDVDKAFRMPVQDVYKFTRGGDNRRIVAGTILSGQISVGDEVKFYPSGKKSRIKSIEGFNVETQRTIEAGYAAGFTLEEQIYVKRGEILTKSDEKSPDVTSRIRVSLFWLGEEAMEYNKEYIFKLGTSKIKVNLEEIIKVIDTSNLEDLKAEKIDKYNIAECILKLDRPIAFDLAHEMKDTSRFVIVDNYKIVGGGLIRAALEDKHEWIREKVTIRNSKWERSMITKEERAEKYNQKPRLILITGEKNVGKKTIAKLLEKSMFEDEKIVYFLGIGNVLYGIDADIKKKEASNKKEHLRRLGEIANLMIDAGIILIITALELTQEELNIIKTSTNYSSVEIVWIGKRITTDILYDLHIMDTSLPQEAIARIKGLFINDKME